MRNQTKGWLWLPAALLAAMLGTPAPAAAQVAAMVNGSPITVYDLEQRARYVQLATHKNMTRQEALNELIDEKIKVQEVQRYGMDAPQSEINQNLASMAGRAGLSTEQFKQALAGKGVGIETVTSKLRAEMVWNQLVRARFPATLQIEDKEVNDVLAKKGGEGDTVAYDYRLRQILFIVPKGSAPSAYEGRMREAEALRIRFENCEGGFAMTRLLRDVALRDPVRRTSADLPGNLRDVLNNMQVGKLTKPEVTKEGVAVFALCDKKENTTDTPQKRIAKNALFNARFEAQSKKYLAELRRQALIDIRIK